MCGIVGYTGKKEAVLTAVEALKKLEYRGYDSAGVAVQESCGISVVKCKGRIADLENALCEKKICGTTAIAHTRWATHGCPSKANAHPHNNVDSSLVLVHNGIIENYSELKEKLKKDGVIFTSETDTEVVAHILSGFYKGNLEEALKKTLKVIHGSYALAVMHKSEFGKIVVARRDSPLVIGLGKGENFIASDVSAIIAHTRRVIYLDDNQIAVITPSKVELFDNELKPVKYKVHTIDFTVESAQRGGFKHFMVKEIHEQPEIIARILSRYVKGERIDFPDFSESRFLKNAAGFMIIACGTAYHAGMVGKYAIEQLARVPVSTDLASEFRYRNPIVDKNTVIVAVSQSGETADTIAAVREAKRRGAKIIAICNVVGSSLTREADAVIYTSAGPEISVASTKAYTAQVAVLYLLALYLAHTRKTLKGKEFTAALNELKHVPAKQAAILKHAEKIREIAKKHMHFGAFLYLGRNINFPTALEGALKLKELSYIPAEGYPAGEMKHGPIALIDEYRAVVCVANDSSVYEKMISNMQEILARKGNVVVVATEGNDKIKNYSQEVVYIPKIDEIFSALLTVVPLQLFAYYMADLKGFDVDKPRNLAKSVTVE